MKTSHMEEEVEYRSGIIVSSFGSSLTRDLQPGIRLLASTNLIPAWCWTAGVAWKFDMS